MKALDTNVLVRLLTRDDEAQAKKAYAYVKKNQPVLINHIVLCETMWVLAKLYEHTKTEIVKILDNMLLSDIFVIAENDIVWAALNEFQNHTAEFSDILIGHINHKNNAITATFDKKAARIRYFEHLA
jgi:predicted nucleic-acid-binding protein